MPEAKSRYIDYYPDEFISGVAAKLPYEEQGMYWMICSLIMSNGGPIENDIDHLARLGCLSRTKAKNLLSKLLKRGKIIENDGVLSQKRAENEVKKAIKRIETAQNNGAKGGRPPKKNSALEKPTGLFSENLTINHQPSTTNYNGHFAEWWSLYPKKIARKDVEKKYIKILKSEEATSEQLLEGLKSYNSHIQKNKTEPSFIKHPSTWLNKGCWDDEYEPAKQKRMRV